MTVMDHRTFYGKFASRGIKNGALARSQRALATDACAAPQIGAPAGWLGFYFLVLLRSSLFDK